MSIDEYDRKMKSAKSSMSIWSGPYQSAYSKNEYQEAKDEYDENAQNKKNAEKKAKKLADAGCNGKTVVMGIRPEDIGDSEIEIEAHQDCAFEADVTGYELLGSEVLLYFKVAGTSMTAKVDSRTTARMGDHIKLAIDPEKIHVFDKETELTITN